MNNISYSLYAGTLLGAVRHKGFIPWDDDIDICMLREDYERFIDLWKKSQINDYYLLNNDISQEFKYSFTKICKKHTTMLSSKEVKDRLQTAIDIDIFPVDRIPKCKIKQIIFKIRCIFYHLLLRKHEPTDAPPIVIWICKAILKIRNVDRDQERIHKLLTKIKFSNKDKRNDLIFIETMRTLKRIYPADLFDNIIDIEFEGRTFKAFKNWDSKLTIDFGDYMKIPPIEERKPSHSSKLIDFNHDYSELEKEGLI